MPADVPMYVLYYVHDYMYDDDDMFWVNLPMKVLKEKNLLEYVGLSEKDVEHE